MACRLCRAYASSQLATTSSSVIIGSGYADTVQFYRSFSKSSTLRRRPHKGPYKINPEDIANKEDLYENPGRKLPVKAPRGVFERAGKQSVHEQLILNMLELSEQCYGKMQRMIEEVARRLGIEQQELKDLAKSWADKDPLGLRQLAKGNERKVLWNRQVHPWHPVY